MQMSSKLINILACPECRSSLKNERRNDSDILKCKGCRKEYPFINVIYITDKCRPNKCNRECLQVCRSGKLEYFPWTKISKRIRILQCNACGACLNACPYCAIEVHKAPSFINNHSCNNNMKTAGSNQVGLVPELLRKPESMFMCGHVASTYDYVSSKIEEIDPEFVIDIGCGHNLFAAKYGIKRNYYTLDGRIDYHAYRKVDLLADGEKLPLADNCVPMVISNFVLEHVHDPKRYLSEIMRVLEKEGILIISTPTQYWHFINLFSFYAAFEYFKKILESPIEFFKNPWRHFIINRAHEKEHCWGDFKADKTIFDEISNWNVRNWRALYMAERFEVISEKVTGNLFSGHHLRLCGNIYNPKKFGAHVTFLLKKRMETNGVRAAL